MNSSVDTIFGSDIENHELVGVNQEGRREGVYIIGSNGTGKSTLLERMVIDDISQEIGTLVLDIHGRLVDGILSKIPPCDAPRCFYLDMTDPDWSFGLNLFECDDPSKVSTVADQAVTSFHKIWSNSWGQTLQTILFNTAYVFATHGNLTLAEVPRFLRDDVFRDRLIAVLPAFHPVRDFWEYDYRTTTDRASTIRRVQDFISSDTLYPVVAQEKTTIPFRQLMDQRMTLLVKLNPEAERASELVGALILSRVFQAALSRLKDMSEAECYAKQFHLYCDEYDRFCSPQFAQMMREVRKCGVGITIAHQDRDKLDSANEAATLQLGTQIVFRVGVDASEMARYFPRPTELGEPVQKRKMQPVYKTWSDVRWGKPEDEQTYNEAGVFIKKLEQQKKQLATDVSRDNTARYRIDEFAQYGVNYTISLHSCRAVNPDSIIDYIKAYGTAEKQYGDFSDTSILSVLRFGHVFLGVEYRLDPVDPFDLTVSFSAEKMVQLCTSRNTEFFELLSPEQRAELHSILQHLFEKYLKPRVFHYTSESEKLRSPFLHYSGSKKLRFPPGFLRYTAYTDELHLVENSPSMHDYPITRFFEEAGFFDPFVFSESMLEPVRRFCDQLKAQLATNPEDLSRLEQKRQQLLTLREQLWAAKVTETHQEYLGETPVTGYDPASGRENAPLYEMVREPRQLTQSEFAQRLSSLPDRTAWTKLVTGTVHHIKTLPPPPPTQIDRTDRFAQSREFFCRSRREIQIEVAMRHGDLSGTRPADQDALAHTKRVSKREPLPDHEN